LLLTCGRAPQACDAKVDDYLATAKDGSLQIVGYYCANERFDNYDLGSLAKNIGDQIAKHCPQSAILLLDYRLLADLSNGNTKKPVVQVTSSAPFCRNA